MAKWIDDNALAYVWQIIKNKFVAKVDGKGLSTNDFTDVEKTKLAGVAEGANKYAHPGHTAYVSGLYKVTVDSQGHITSALAVSKADITGLGIPGQDTTYGIATQSTNGLMPKEDKAKLDGIAEGANKYVHPSYTQKASGLYKITVDAFGHVSAVTPVIKTDITGLGIPAQDTKYSPVTTGTNGLMIAADKVKLDGYPAYSAIQSTYATKQEIVGMYKYKGSVNDASKLPTTGQKVGDVYNVETTSIYGAAGANVAWNGSTWDSLGEIFTLLAITNAEIDAICV